MQDEPFEIFDEEGRLSGVAPRSLVHRRGLWHRAVNVFLFRKDGRLIIQRRQWSKDVCPGKWDLSVAEHLKPGETYEQGAFRGLQEELGVGGVMLEPIGGIFRFQLDVAERMLKDHELAQSFRGVFEGEIRPDAGEVCEIGTIGLAELGEAFANRPDDFTPWFRESAMRLGLCRGGE